MKYIYGILLFVWTAAEVVKNTEINDPTGTGFILTALCLFAIKEKYLDRELYSCIYGAVIVALSYNNHYLLILLGIVFVDLAYFKRYYMLGIAAFIAFILLNRMGVVQVSFHLAAGVLWGYTLRKSDDKEKTHLTLLDNERALRYQLEKTKSELVTLQNEIEQTAEIRERDRIAKEIHDNVGHSIAGVLFQLRAAERIVLSDSHKVERILKLCAEKLVDALETTRNTVYNIKSSRAIGIESIHEIIKDFKFCKIDFSHNGDFDKISTANLKVMEATTKELLTNASKHSEASEITLHIDIKIKHIRCLYRDNGKGCNKIIESVGLAGIRDRIKNLGGTYSVDGSNGFTVVYTLPNIKEAEA